MTTQKIKNYLDEKGIEYTVSRHSNAYTAQEVASKAHISGKEFAKTVIITMSNRLVMCVLPASYRVDFNLLKEALGTNDISLATETEFKFIFPDCEIGAMPPFGNLYDMDVYVAESLTTNEKIAFNAGTHTETIKMNYSDFKNLVNPRIIKFSKKEFTFPGDPSERWSHDY